MYALALDQDELPNMLKLAELFLVMDVAGLKLADDLPEGLDPILAYLSEWTAPPPTDEASARAMVSNWLKAYYKVYGALEEKSNLGVDTPH